MHDEDCKADQALMVPVLARATAYVNRHLKPEGTLGGAHRHHDEVRGRTSTFSSPNT